MTTKRTPPELTPEYIAAVKAWSKKVCLDALQPTEPLDLSRYKYVTIPLKPIE